MTGITLTSSMRKNLLSLRMISSQMSKVQNRLSTGLKVSSAIDNSSSYYQAHSLNNRAADLEALLDSMGQSIQTIRVANEGIEQGLVFLEQMKSIAGQTQEVNLVELSKSWFEEQARNQGGVVVSNAEELKEALLENKNPPKLIVVYGRIDINLDDAGFNQSISLKDNQKLVGTEYFADINKNALYRGSDNKRLSELNMVSAKANRHGIQIKDVAATISDLTINSNLSGMAVNIHASANTSYVHNVDIAHESPKGGGLTTCLNAYGTRVKLTGTINLTLKNGSDQRIIFINGSAVEVDADINFLTQNSKHFWIQGSNARLNISANSKITAARQVNFNGLTSSSQIASGAKIGLTEKNIFYELLQNFSNIGNRYFNNTEMAAHPEMFAVTEGWALEVDYSTLKMLSQTSSKLVAGYNSLLAEYDKLISDSSYQGINLLKGGRLNVTFNETRSHRFRVQGRDMSATGLGIFEAEWEAGVDVAKTLGEIQEAISTLRDYSAELGNNYQIIQTRQNFTDALIGVLETGADNLTLADMNEESANYLALQTRQQLAINSLSLAAQSAQSILSLF